MDSRCIAVQKDEETLHTSKKCACSPGENEPKKEMKEEGDVLLYVLGEETCGSLLDHQLPLLVHRASMLPERLLELLQQHTCHYEAKFELLAKTS